MHFLVTVELSPQPGVLERAQVFAWAFTTIPCYSTYSFQCKFSATPRHPCANSALTPNRYYWIKLGPAYGLGFAAFIVLTAVVEVELSSNIRAAIRTHHLRQQSVTEVLTLPFPMHDAMVIFSRLLCVRVAHTWCLPLIGRTRCTTTMVFFKLCRTRFAHKFNFLSSSLLKPCPCSSLLCLRPFRTLLLLPSRVCPLEKPLETRATSLTRVCGKLAGLISARTTHLGS